MLKFPLRARSRLGCCFNYTRFVFTFDACPLQLWFVLFLRRFIKVDSGNFHYFRLDVHCFLKILNHWLNSESLHSVIILPSSCCEVWTWVSIFLCDAYIWGQSQHYRRQLQYDNASVNVASAVGPLTSDGGTLSSSAVWEFLLYVHWTSIYNFDNDGESFC